MLSQKSIAFRTTLRKTPAASPAVVKEHAPMKPQDFLAQDAWFRLVGDRRGGFSLVAVITGVYEMLAGRGAALYGRRHP
jgi:hypothetical protein